MFRTRDLLVRQRTQLINAIRGHLTEYGWIAPKGPSHVAMLADLLEEEEMASSLPEAARAMFRLMLDLLQPRREPGGPEVVAGVVVEGGYGATVGETGPEKPDVLIVPAARIYDLVPVRELPYGPAAPSLHQRPDRWQHLTTCQPSSKNRLHCTWRGGPDEVKSPL